MYYNNYYPQPQDNLMQLRNQYQPPQQMNVDERIWVQGRGSAEAYLVAPNSFVRLWDAQSPVFYEKRADQTGKPYMEVFKYEKLDAQKDTGLSDRFSALEARIEALEKAGANNVQ